MEEIFIIIMVVLLFCMLAANYYIYKVSKSWHQHTLRQIWQWQQQTERWLREELHRRWGNHVNNVSDVRSSEIQRIEKSNELRNLGVNPYPHFLVKDMSIKEFRDKFAFIQDLEEKKASDEVKIAGRLKLKRVVPFRFDINADI